ncbi:MAG: peptidase and in kexin sedolisin [Frankiales bacterium]|nr:peptidase and in kexin sedolisin [Frankiales bacterium]
MLRALLAPLLLVPALLAHSPAQAFVVSTPGAPEPVLRALHLHAQVFSHGFAARLTSAQLQALRRVPGVVVEPNEALRLASTQSTSSWGLDRIDQRSLPLNGHYRYPNTASTVHAYVIDTGIATSHPDFGGRAEVAFDALGGNGQDCNGHGTHVAGIVGGTTYGVAKRVRLEAVRVMDCSGRSSTSAVLAGIDWVRQHAVKPAVANLSLGGSFSAVLDRAVDDLADSGVFVAVAAGNSAADACQSSPAAAGRVVTVAASTRTDARAPWSNVGSCVDLFAPGLDITSDWPGGGTKVESGTSMATPFVTGAAAVYLSKHSSDSTATVNAWLEGHATTGKLKHDPSGTPNRLLYTGAI